MGLAETGVVVDEANLLCRVKKKRWVGVNSPKVAESDIVAWGDRALDMQHVEPKHLEIIAPISRGVVIEFGALVEILSKCFSMTMEVPSSRMYLFKPRVICSISSVPSSVERRALEQALLLAGASEVVFLSSLEVWSKGFFDKKQQNPCVVVDIGAEKTEAGVFTAAGLVSGGALRSGGKDIDNCIIFYFKMRYGLELGNRAAGRLKFALLQDEDQIMVRGKNLETGMPDVVTILKTELQEGMTLELAKIARLVRQTIESCPSEIVEQLSSNGGYLCGGGGQLYGLAEFLQNEIKIPFVNSMDPVSGLVRNSFLYGKKNK